MGGTCRSPSPQPAKRKQNARVSPVRAFPVIGPSFVFFVHSFPLSFFPRLPVFVSPLYPSFWFSLCFVFLFFFFVFVYSSHFRFPGVFGSGIYVCLSFCSTFYTPRAACEPAIWNNMHILFLSCSFFELSLSIAFLPELNLIFLSSLLGLRFFSC